MAVSLTGRILDGEDLSGFTRVSDPGLILSSDLELNLGAFVYVRHLELSLFVRSLATLQPACSQLLFLLNHIPVEQVTKCGWSHSCCFMAFERLSRDYL